MNNKFVYLLWEGFSVCRAILTLILLMSLDNLKNQLSQQDDFGRFFSLVSFGAFAVMVFAMWALRLSHWLEVGLDKPQSPASLKRQLSEARKTAMSLAAELHTAYEEMQSQAQPTPAVVTYIPRQQYSRAGYVYLLKEVNGANYKIGRTRNPADRRRTFKVKLPFQVDYVCLIKTDDMYALENQLHNQYRRNHVNGEWFALDDTDVASIVQLSQEAEG